MTLQDASMEPGPTWVHESEAFFNWLQELSKRHPNGSDMRNGDLAKNFFPVLILGKHDIKKILNGTQVDDLRQAKCSNVYLTRDFVDFLEQLSEPSSDARGPIEMPKSLSGALVATNPGSKFREETEGRTGETKCPVEFSSGSTILKRAPLTHPISMCKCSLRVFIGRGFSSKAALWNITDAECIVDHSRHFCDASHTHTHTHWESLQGTPKEPWEAQQGFR